MNKLSGRSPTEAVADLQRSMQQSRALADPDLVAKVLPKDTVFATIAFCSTIIGTLREKMEVRDGGKITTFAWKGVDEASSVVGYLSHNGHNLRFQTKDQTCFDLPFAKVHTEPCGLGLLVKTPTVSYAIGHYEAVNATLSPRDKMRYGFGEESAIWIRELGNIGAIDIEVKQRARRRLIILMTVWFSAIVLVTVFLLVHSF